jgi:hypothetical protein
LVSLPGELKKSMSFINVLTVTICIFPVLLSWSCSRDRENTVESLNAYCVRECVIDTSDSQICDTRCKCAVEKLAGGMSGEEFLSLVDGITKNDAASNEYIEKFKNAFDGCKSIE